MFYRLLTMNKVVYNRVHSPLAFVNSGGPGMFIIIIIIVIIMECYSSKNSTVDRI